MTNELRTKVDGILKTLPIGYYIKKQVPVTLDDCSASHYDFVSKTITISTQQLDESIAKLDDPNKIENDIRCMLYHEVSHAFASYKWDLNDSFGWSSIMNIFEDERIETIFAKKYMGVDFKEYVKRLGGFEEMQKEGPKTPEQFFYSIVRFRFGPKKFVDRVADIITRYADVGPYTTSSYHAYDYRNEVHQLWKDVCNYFGVVGQQNIAGQYQQSAPAEQGQGQLGQDQQGQQGQGQGQQGQEGDEDDQDQGGQGDQEDQEESEEGQGGQKEIEKEDPEEKVVEKKEVKQPLDGNAIVGGVGDPYHGEGFDEEDIYEKVADTFIKSIADKYINKEMQQKFDTIINNANKNNAKNSSAINSYSGVFDPRSAGRKDCRFFLQKNRLGNVKQYSKLHLNLFIDNSGSYNQDDYITNCMLSCLSSIEKTNHDFTFQLVTINMEVVEHKNNDITLCSSGCNRLPDSLFETVKKYQYRDRHVINIVMFDGDFVTGETNAHREKAISNCAAFNVPNTTIITDRDNEERFKKYCKGAKIIVTKNYAQELIDHVTMAIQVGLQ